MAGCGVGWIDFIGYSGAREEVVVCAHARIQRALHGPERLRVYQLALTFARKVDGVLNELGCRSALCIQLVRAAESIILNIAEGAAHFSPGRKRYYYQIAHGSAGECIAAHTRLKALYPTLDLRYLRRDADMICVMLTALIRRLSEEDPKRPR